MKSKSAPGKLVRDARGRFAEKKSMKMSRSSMSTPRKMVKDLKEWLAEKMSSAGAKKRSSSIPKKSIKRSRSSKKNKSASAGKLVRDARGRFAEKFQGYPKEVDEKVKVHRDYCFWSSSCCCNWPSPLVGSLTPFK